MSKKARTRLLKYGISSAVCLAVAGIYVYLYPLNGTDKDLFMCLSNAFFLPGILTTFSGLLVFVSNEGVFDGVGFVLHTVVHALLPFGRFGRSGQMKYGDYVEQRRGKNPSGYGFLILVGLVFVLIGAVFAYLYSNC